MGFVKEFKDFAMRGNVIDLAIGVVIGGAFNGIVTKMVDAVIMPIVGIVTGESKLDDIRHGATEMVSAIFNFLIVAFALFLIVKAINRFKAKTVQEAPAPTTSEVLLGEIRDALAKR